ncbi:hypothetical protein TSA1_14705 [Bradyrhizobium nitroreducens]|uniref:Uncharacterized protein n=1 Tax=Bradyrhizobium nitroreducens TaxID=709803 RepID=A0A2M6UBF3_9BRAD|nr:hypothetical protein TSA1_14705 [Bradyrhizobium nitroreducens]
MPEPKMKAETKAEVMRAVLDGPGLIKSEQCVDIMVLADSGTPKDCSCLMSCVQGAQISRA